MFRVEVRLLLEANAAKADRLSSAHALVSAAHGGHTGIVRYLLAARTATGLLSSLFIVFDILSGYANAQPNS